MNEQQNSPLVGYGEAIIHIALAVAIMAIVDGLQTGIYGENILPALRVGINAVCASLYLAFVLLYKGLKLNGQVGSPRRAARRPKIQPRYAGPSRDDGSEDDQDEDA